MSNVIIKAKVQKTDDDQHLAFGWASIIEENGEPITDFQGDMISQDVLEKAAYDYVLDVREAGEMHETIGVGKIIESMVFTEEKIAALELPPGSIPVGWWLGFKIFDEEVYAKVKSGEYQMFSIGGEAIREEAESE